MPLLIGTSGWQYRHCRETFYPRGVTQAKWLEYNAARFATVESNAAFYRLRDVRLELDRLERTLDAFPDGIRVAVEFRHGSRFTDEVRAKRWRNATSRCVSPIAAARSRPSGARRIGPRRTCTSTTTIELGRCATLDFSRWPDATRV